MINIVIADDHNLVRAGFKSILEKETNIKIIAEADNGNDAIKIVLELIPDIVLMDINMKETNGITATSLILEKNKDIKIIGLSMYSDISYVRAILKSGAKGYLLKSIDPEELLSAINEVYNDNIYICKDINNKIISDYVYYDQTIKEQEVLNEKEKTIIKYICQGKTSKEIAFLTEYSVKSIDMYRSEIMRKINAKSVSDIVIYAVKERIFIISEEEQNIK